MTVDEAFRLVLASASPRRHELLAGLGLAFEVRPADLDETPLPGEGAADMVRRLAEGKAAALARPGEVVLGADTVVGIDDRILGKPVDLADATAMLQRLSGRTHVVTTGVAVHVVPGKGATRHASIAVETAVTFIDLSDHDIRDYLATEEPFDKAGSYGLQGIGARFVASISGSPTSVIGLPLADTVRLLDSVGIDLRSLPRADASTVAS